MAAVSFSLGGGLTVEFEGKVLAHATYKPPVQQQPPCGTATSCGSGKGGCGSGEGACHQGGEPREDGVSDTRCAECGESGGAAVEGGPEEAPLTEQAEMQPSFYTVFVTDEIVAVRGSCRDPFPAAYAIVEQAPGSESLAFRAFRDREEVWAWLEHTAVKAPELAQRLREQLSAFPDPAR